MPLHGLGITAWQHETGTDAPGRTDRTEEIGRLRALVLRCRGSGATPGPAPREPSLLPDPGFVLPPDLYVRAGRERCPDLPHLGWEFFLKSSSAYSFCPLCRGRAAILQNPMARSSRPTEDSSREMPNSSNIQSAKSLRRQRTTPCTAGIGPCSTIRARARRCSSLSFARWPGALRSISPSAPPH